MIRQRFLFAGLLLVALLVSSPSSPVFAQGWQGDQLVIGRAFVLPSGQELNGDVVVVGGEATLEQGSTVTGNVALLGGKLTAGGTVTGDVAILGGQAVLQEGSVIEGQLGTFGSSVQQDPGAVVRGESYRVPQILTMPRLVPWSGAMQWWLPRPNPMGAAIGILLWPLQALGWALLLALVGVVAVLIAPKGLERIAAGAAIQPALSFGVGLLTLAVSVVAGTLLLVACCLGTLLWLATVIAWFVGWLGVGLWVGQRLLGALKVQNASVLGEVALGVALITLLARLPWCIGFIFGLGFGCIGLGAVVLTRFGTRVAGPSLEEPSSALTT
jgi:hypothetical protein